MTLSLQGGVVNDPLYLVSISQNFFQLSLSQKSNKLDRLSMEKPLQRSPLFMTEALKKAPPYSQIFD
jgi:hypothetical protein